MNTLNECTPFPGDDMVANSTNQPGEFCFIVSRELRDLVYVYNCVQCFEAYISWELAQWKGFSIGKWFAEQCTIVGNDDAPWVTADKWMSEWYWDKTTI